ncbi:MAG: response regulator, partial [Halofilum sp. (in: g-proteobacteria)]
PGPEDVAWLEALAHTAGVIVERDLEPSDKRERLDEERDALLDMVAAGHPVADCLSALCAAIPRLDPGTRACVQLADAERRRFRASVAPDFESIFREAVEGAPVDDVKLGSCAGAISHGQSVTCPDTENDPLGSQAWRDLCVACAIRACHAEPIMDSNARPLASFMLCFDQPQLPNAWARRLAAFGARIAAIALGRERSNDALRESEERYRAVVTTTSDVVYRMSADWSEMRTLRGYPFLSDTEEPDRDWLSKYIHPDDQPKVLETIQQAIEHKKIFELEHRVLRPDGTLGWTLSRAIAVLDEDGEITEWFGTASDITERRRAEDALRESEARLRELNHSLEQRVDERTHELQRQAERLRGLAIELTTAEQRERRRLAAMLHDDLQQSAVAGRIQLKQCRSRVYDQTAIDAIGTTEDLLDEIMATSRDLTRQLRPAALYEDGLIAALRGLASDIERRYLMHVALDSGDANPALAEDAKVFVFETCRELLINAAKHADADRATISIRHEQKHLHVAVCDRGAGFDPETIDTPTPHGTGFGLFSIRERLAALGGNLQIESAPTWGTRIELALPVTDLSDSGAPREFQAAHAQLVPADASSHCTRVLLVDDHVVVRQGLAQLLESHAELVVVGEAGDGAEAVGLFQQRMPDVVLMDVNMPGMNGVEATHRICRRWPEAIVIGLSVQDNLATDDMMREAGAAGFLAKSGNGEEMLATIRRLTYSGGHKSAFTDCHETGGRAV